MEIFRQHDIADDVRRVGNLPLDIWRGFGYMTRINGPDLGAIDLLSDPVQAEQSRTASPERIAWCAQDALEPFLREQLDRYPSVTVKLGLRGVGVEQDAHGVAVAFVDEDGKESAIRARYAVGADGGRSAIRQALGVEAPTSETFGSQLNARFEADLLPFMGDRRHMVWWIINPDTIGGLLTYDGTRQWCYSWSYDPSKETAEDYPPERCAEVIRQAVGVDDLDVKVEGLFPWSVDAAVADQFKVGRVLLVGDAAHRFPPVGGFGMNSGIQDSHNLGWKLHLALRGLADDGLLDSYAEERRAVAMRNTVQVMHQTKMAAKVGWILSDPEAIAKIESPEGEQVRQSIIDGIPAQEEQYWTYGQQLGTIYDSAAVVGDGTEAEQSTIALYHPTAHPGARAPHLWLIGGDGTRRSTLDLLHSRFTLLSTPAGRDWAEAAREAAARLGLELATYTIGATGDFEEEDVDWAKLYGVGPEGAVLVRPDGHVAFRAADRADNPGRVLDDTLAKLLRSGLQAG
jgi:tetracenomycin A2 monooxygenase-dioxygenase